MTEWSKEHRATFPLISGDKVMINDMVIFVMPKGKHGPVAFDIMEKEDEVKE